jgi:hypothetical protein
MKTLVIHPEDSSTAFLTPIYKDIKDATIITKNKNRQEILKYIAEHDRIIMLGHGSSSGLFGIQFKDTFVIDSQCVDALRGKDNVYIWCNADKFVMQHQLEGFYSGMFVSEVSEAIFCGIKNFNADEVDTSNRYFAYLLSTVVDSPSHQIYESVKPAYQAFAAVNKIAKYNSERLYLA